MARFMALFTGLLLLLFSGAALGQAVIAADAAADASAANGTDLSNWAFEADGAFQLQNNWVVYRDQLMSPARFSAQSCLAAPASGTAAGPEAVSLPDIWGPGFTATVTSGHGTATYCQAVALPNDGNFYSLRMGTLRSVSQIYAVYLDSHGEKKTILLHKNGAFENTGEQLVNNPALPTLALPYGVSKFALIIQLSNRIHKQGGIIEAPTIDLKWRLDAAGNRATGLPSALVIVLLFVSVGAFLFGMRTHDSTDHRMFSFLAFATAMRAAFVSDLIWDYLPAFSLARKYDLEYLSLFVVAVAYYAFVNRLLRPGKILKIDYAIYGLTGALIIFALFLAPFFAPGTITLTREPIQIIWGMIVLMVLYSVIKASILSSERAKEAMVVGFAGFIYAAYEILSSFGIITSSMEWSQFIVFVVVMVHAQVFVTKARQTEHERDALTERLQDANRKLQNRALALDFALKRAEEASKAKSNFLATFSHELRTPLNAIIGFSELMVREVFGAVGSPHYKEYANDINSSGTHLLALVDDILALSSTEAGASDLTEQSVDVCVLAEETLSLLKIQAAKKKITMSMEKALDVPHLLGDERKIRQVLINLVTNAIKFNKEKGTIKVVIHADETGLYIDVVDTGIGIAEEDIPLVLSRFGQADSSSKQTDGTGVGIGLPLSEVIVRQHGGTLKVTSRLGEGTCVAIWFPAERMERLQELALS